MDIQITENAQKYLEKNNKKNIIIDISNRFTCDCGEAKPAIMVLAAQSYNNEKDYREIIVGNYKIFIDTNNLVVNGSVIIDTNPEQFNNSLMQKGIEISIGK